MPYSPPVFEPHHGYASQRRDTANLFNQPCSSEDDQALYQKRRTQLSNIVQDVGQLKDEEPMD
jgi:hypothetical protein